MPHNQRHSNREPANRPPVRCAIYTRKSTEEGLEQPFNSLDAQREAAEAYISSQRHQGWILQDARYDDGGFSGGNMERPALQRLLRDVEAGRIDCVAVYKVDRLSRSLLDFARILEVFEKRGVSFVSITQQFNTSASWGRLSLNILLSFAQYERELISERTRDKMSAARRKGKWVGGFPVLGYDVDPLGGRLVVNQAEAARVREIFGLFLHHRNLAALVEELDRRGRRGKDWSSKRGRHHPGQPITKEALGRLLTNVIYAGKVNHKGTIYAGEHLALVEPEVWRQVQQILQQNQPAQSSSRPSSGKTLLAGLLYCAACNVRMFASHTRKGGRVYPYYVCLRAQQRGWRCCPTKSLPAEGIEQAVLSQLRALANTAGTKIQLRQKLFDLQAGWEDATIEERAKRLKTVVSRIEYDRLAGRVSVEFRPELEASVRPFAFQRQGPEERASKSGRLPRVTRLLALAIKFEDLVRRRVVTDYADLARLGLVSRARMSQIMGLLNLAPQIQEQILLFDKVTRGPGPVAERDLRRLTAVLSWQQQVQLWRRMMAEKKGGPGPQPLPPQNEHVSNGVSYALS